MKGFKLDKCQRRCESRDDGQNGCRYRDSERERPTCLLRHYSSPSSPNSGIRNNSEQGRLYGDEASRAASATHRKVHLNENRVVAYAFAQGSNRATWLSNYSGDSNFTKWIFRGHYAERRCHVR
jgi:hypothetical protein